MTKDLIKTLIAEYQQYVTRVKLIPRQVKFIDGQNYVLVGLRHAGKSYLMYQRLHISNQSAICKNCKNKRARTRERKQKLTLPHATK